MKAFVVASADSDAAGAFGGQRGLALSRHGKAIRTALL